ncbi:MarR family winged helix-turn-helix transcriptional regulator [Micromonospora rhizosphaerae]|uniref:MarR family winged helix-turn-helix transcriptional regulator n=1 Tax=Micromonospora rhizosphaerae TaxID=568872 RepID=UPI001FE022EF|nr:MarR family transcriptional regulator [Micromonospora rhizosphaerae]
MNDSADERLQPLTPVEEAVVRALGRIMHALPRAIDLDMRQEQHLPLIDYDALMHLSEAPERRMRMSELATACELSLSGMSRLAAHLESEGLVRRVRSENDARVSYAVLTDAGFARLERAWPTNLASIRRNFLDHLQGLDLAMLAKAFERTATPGDAAQERQPGEAPPS